MASEPKKNQIAAAVVAALGGVRKGAGYRTEIGRNVSRRRLNEVTVAKATLPAASVWIGSGKPSARQCTGSYTETAVIVVEVWVRSLKEGDLDEECLNAEADVKAAVLANPTLGLSGVVVTPNENVADHQEFADLKVGSKAVGFTVDYNWTASAP